MRVVFDGYWWVEGPLSNRMVEREFINTWLRNYPDDEATVLVPRAHHSQASAELGSRARVLGTSLRPHAAAAVVALPQLARRVRADVIVAHNFTPARGRAVTFIHDVLFQTDPNWFTPVERLYLAPIPRLARRASAVATSSATEAARIRAVNPRLRVVVPVGLSVGTEISSVRPRRPTALPAVEEFVLTVGRLNIRKNLALTISSAISSGAVSARRPLVVVGEPDGRHGDLVDATATAKRAGSLVFLNGVTNAELAWLYANTRLFVFLSLGEGYGLPPVEALRFGAPVLASDLPIFHETLGQHATFVDPRDSARVSAQLSTLLAGPKPCLSAGPAADMDWSGCAARLRELCLQVTRQC